jgi:hypothetical protein
VHGGGLALLLSALGLAGLRTGALPRPLAIAALAAAAVDALTPLVLALPRGCTSYPGREVSQLRDHGNFPLTPPDPQLMKSCLTRGAGRSRR